MDTQLLDGHAEDGRNPVIPRNVTLTKRRRHFAFPGDLPGRILVLYHLSGTLAEEAARTVHVSQHREATERVVRIRSPIPMRGCSETGRQDRTQGSTKLLPRRYLL